MLSVSAAEFFSPPFFGKEHLRDAAIWHHRNTFAKSYIETFDRLLSSGGISEGEACVGMTLIKAAYIVDADGYAPRPGSYFDKVVKNLRRM